MCPGFLRGVRLEEWFAGLRTGLAQWAAKHVPWPPGIQAGPCGSGGAMALCYAFGLGSLGTVRLSIIERHWAEGGGRGVAGADWVACR